VPVPVAVVPGKGIAQVLQRGCGGAKRAAQAWQMRCAGQAWQTAHWLGQCCVQRCQPVDSLENMDEISVWHMLVSNIRGSCWAFLPLFF
jgi:hypothetical protein